MSDCCGEIIYKGLCKRGRPVEVMDCAVCGFKHLHPKPSAQELDAYYKSSYFATEKPDYAATSGTESEYQELVDKEKIEAAEVASLPDRALTVLDYGCGPSAPFLKHVANRFRPSPALCLVGYEPSATKSVRRVCMQDAQDSCWITIYNSFCFEGAAIRFNLIHLGFVLEHVANPVATLLEVRKHLAPRGRVIIEVPNDFNPIQMHLWRTLAGVPWWVSSPDHVNHFDLGSLTATLHKVGLVVGAHGTTYPVELFLAHGHDFRTDPEAASLVVKHRAELHKLWGCFGGVGGQIGRTVWMVASCK